MSISSDFLFHLVYLDRPHETWTTSKTLDGQHIKQAVETIEDIQ